jgi:hypothetical protein
MNSPEENRIMLGKAFAALAGDSYSGEVARRSIGKPTWGAGETSQRHQPVQGCDSSCAPTSLGRMLSCDIPN